ncbi:MAG: hypothetical protein ACRDZO_29455 [Egibacteraceae bacterium]
MSNWAARWREVIQDPRLSGRVSRGTQFHRSGRVSGVRATRGFLSGRVQGTRVTPFLVEIEVGTLDDEQWSHIVGVLASQLRHGARLLAGLAPEGLDTELEAAGIALFPVVEDLDVTCACGDVALVCAHAAALWEAAAEHLRADPFLLFRVRGRGRDQLLAELAEARRRDGEPPAPSSRAGIPVEDLDPQGWTGARAPLEDVHLVTLCPPSTAAAALKLLGDPPGWAGSVSAWDLFRPLVERAAAYARDLEPS